MFTRQRGERVHLAATLLLSLTLVVGDNLQWRWLESLRTWLYAGVEPIYLAIAWPGTAFDDLADSIRFGSALKRENAHLRQTNLVLAARVQKLSYLTNDNARLRGLTAAAGSIAGRVIVTEVIGVDPETTHHVLIVNRGASSGLYKGQPMLDARGVVGRVQWLGQHTARIMLISDRQHSVPVRINRNGMRAILSGTGDPAELSLQFVPETAGIKAGDLLVTSGLGRDFPAGYPVGRVTRIRKVPGEQFLDISAQPVAALDRSRYLLALFEQPSMASAAAPPALSPELVPANTPAPVSAPPPGPAMNAPAVPEVPRG
ncbi:MAG: rod shape-determining protein MreC [Pseudomonadota bacterium]